MGLFVSTVSSSVVLSDLGITIVHPTIDLVLTEQFDAIELEQSQELTVAIQTGMLTWKRSSTGIIESPEAYYNNHIPSHPWHYSFKGLSPVSCHYNGTAFNGRYLQMFPNVGSDISPFLIPFPCEIAAIAARASAITTGEIGIYVNSLVTPVHKISFAAQSLKTETNLRIPISQAQWVAVKVISGTFSKPCVTLFLSGA